MNRSKIYLTMTVIPTRLISKHFEKVILSLKKQIINFDYLIINLSINDFKFDNIPEYLINDEKIIINKTLVKGPCTKLIGSLDLIPDNSIVIVLDDDIIFKNNFIYSLIKSYTFNSNCITTSFCNMNFNNYFIELMGFGGFVFKITKYIKINLKKAYMKMPKCAFYIDDTWFSWIFNKIGIKIIYLFNTNNSNYIIDSYQTNLHPEWFELSKNTNRKMLTDTFLELVANNKINF